MSEALDYLLSVRPEAMQNYFAFLKQAGKHLDPKTRAIISVITKVDNQTEAGFRQYLSRALSEGVTADEIIDALLLAFPTLGLTKIIWAVDRLLDMELEEFSLDRLRSEKTWHDIGLISEIRNMPASGMSCDGKTVFVYSGAGVTRVYCNICPHQSTPIPKDALEGTLLTCPKHNWTFDLKTGKCVSPGDKSLHEFETRTENNHLYALW